MRCGGLLRFFYHCGPLLRGVALTRGSAREEKGITIANANLVISRLKETLPRKKSPGGKGRGASPKNMDKNPKHSPSLAEFHPGIAQSWVVAVSSKLLRPSYVLPSSRKLAWWRCPGCEHQFTKRIDLHVAEGGACPRCRAKPSIKANPHRNQDNEGLPSSNAASLSLSSLPLRTARHRCRPGSSATAPEVENANRLNKSIADEAAFGGFARPTFLPMLAKNYTKESAKIAPDELIYVSPKLDGIRCLAAYDKGRDEVVFFSRAGTLFECCDAKIAPGLRAAFALDPALVLDGELYDDAANRARAGDDPLLALLARDFLDGPAGPDGGRKSARKRPPRAAETSPAGLSFEQLTAAVRTMRAGRTPAIAALQARLQYHIFDVLDARGFAPASPPCFGLRYQRLRDLLRRARDENARGAHKKNEKEDFREALRLVPALPCGKAEVDALLRAAVRCGYEGVMIRRDSLTGNHATIPNHDEGDRRKMEKNALTEAPALTLDVVVRRLEYAAGVLENLPGRSERKRGLPSSTSTTTTTASRSTLYASGGYAHGQRSGTLLKYKIMRDDEFVIVAAVEGKGKWKGALGAFVCQTKDGKNTFTVTPASNDAEKKAMWRTWETKYRGKVITVQYQELTADGIPRFPVGKCIRGEADGRDWI